MDIPLNTRSPGAGVRAGTNPGNWPFHNSLGPPIEGAWLSTDPGYSGLARPTIGRGYSHTQARPIGLARPTIGRGYSHTQARPIGLARPTKDRGYSHTQTRLIMIGLVYPTIGRVYSYTPARPIGLAGPTSRVLTWQGSLACLTINTKGTHARYSQTTHATSSACPSEHRG